ncbi:unnamed protein product, partial [Polarella glacialis]
ASASSDGSTACDKNCPCNKCNAKVRSLLVEDIPHILADNLGGEDMNKFSCGQLCTMLSGMLHIPEDPEAQLAEDLATAKKRQRAEEKEVHKKKRTQEKEHKKQRQEEEKEKKEVEKQIASEKAVEDKKEKTKQDKGKARNLRRKVQRQKAKQSDKVAHAKMLAKDVVYRQRRVDRKDAVLKSSIAVVEANGASWTAFDQSFDPKQTHRKTTVTTRYMMTKLFVLCGSGRAAICQLRPKKLRKHIYMLATHWSK